MEKIMYRIGLILGPAIFIWGVVEWVLRVVHYAELIQGYFPWAATMSSPLGIWITLVVGILVFAGAWFERRKEKSQERKPTAGDSALQLNHESMPRTIVGATLEKDDPTIVFEFLDERKDQLHKKTAILLRNTGGREALDVRIEPLILRGQRIHFPHIAGAIQSQTSERFDPVTNGRWGQVNTALFVDSLLKEWDTYNDLGMKELNLTMKCTYRDFSRTASFETSCTLVFLPIEEVHNRNLRSRFGNPKSVIQFRNYAHLKTVEIRPK